LKISFIYDLYFIEYGLGEILLFIGARRRLKGIVDSEIKSVYFFFFRAITELFKNDIIR
jgi:hypothetical protein